MTKLFSIALLSILLLAGFTTISFSQDPGSESSDSQLEEIMEELKDNMRAARKLLSNADDHAQCIVHIQAMQQGAIDALPYCPDFKGESSGIEEIKFKLNFKRRMLHLADTLLQLELALHQGDAEMAQEIYQKLKPLKNDSHEIYDPEEEDEGEGE
ncbi:MAG: soluble cytochrome b562 [Myxococcota bacterium]|jgi:soluble cytochrome b562